MYGDDGGGTEGGVMIGNWMQMVLAVRVSFVLTMTVIVLVTAAAVVVVVAFVG